MLPTIRADSEHRETYEYHTESPLERLMTIYGELENREVESKRLAAWSEMIVGACMTRVFPDGHFYLAVGLSANLCWRLASIAPAKLNRECP
jgi:surfactin synthase thioesterase subunit